MIQSDFHAIFIQSNKRIMLRRSVMLTSSMMTKAMSKRTRATIIYATETGKSHMYAEQLRDVFNFAFNSKVSISKICLGGFRQESITISHAKVRL